MTGDLWPALVALQPRLRRFALGLTGSIDEADDLVQTTYERAIGRIAQWQPGTRLDSWLFRIMYTIRLNELAAQRVRGTHLRAVDPDTLPARDEGRAIEARLTLEHLRGFLAALPPEQRAALLLVTVEGLSYRDAAEVLDLEVGTLTSRLGRARAALRAFTDGKAGDARPGDASLADARTGARPADAIPGNDATRPGRGAAGHGELRWFKRSTTKP